MSTDAEKLKQKQKIRKYLVFTGMFLLFLGCMWLIFAPSEKDSGKEDGLQCRTSRSERYGY